MSRVSKSQTSEFVRICGVDYQIIYKSPLEMPNELGLCQSDVQQIWLNNSNTPETMLNTLLHEAVHTIDHALDLDMSERQVKVISTAIIAFFRDNQAVAQQILQTVEHE